MLHVCLPGFCGAKKKNNNTKHGVQGTNEIAFKVFLYVARLTDWIPTTFLPACLVLNSQKIALLKCCTLLVASSIPWMVRTYLHTWVCRRRICKCEPILLENILCWYSGGLAIHMCKLLLEHICSMMIWFRCVGWSMISYGWKFVIGILRHSFIIYQLGLPSLLGLNFRNLLVCTSSKLYHDYACLGL